jgi:hypothetical protein
MVKRAESRAARLCCINSHFSNGVFTRSEMDRECTLCSGMNDVLLGLHALLPPHDLRQAERIDIIVHHDDMPSVEPVPSCHDCLLWLAG